MIFEELEQRISSLVPSPVGVYRVDWIQEDIGFSLSTSGALLMFIRNLDPYVMVEFEDEVKEGMWKSTVDGKVFAAWRFSLESPTLPSIAVYALVLSILRSRTRDEFKIRLKDLLRTVIMSRLGHDAEADSDEESRESVLLGLIGELFFLRMLLASTTRATVVDLIQGWKGSERSSRDFELESTGIEVKTTLKPVSEHYFSGVHQIEIGHLSSGRFENEAFLLSIGLSESFVPDDNSFSIDSLSSEIIGHLEAIAPYDSGASELFLRKLESYFDGQGRGVRSSDRFFNLTFIRSYNMADSNLQVIRSATLEKYPMVVARSVKFVVRLPSDLGGNTRTLAGVGNVSTFFKEVAGGNDGVS